VRLERGSRRLSLRLRAAERPADLVGDATFGVPFRSDSMVETMFRAMDSLRVHLLQANGRDAARLARSSARNAGRPTADPQGGLEAMTAPFEFFVFPGEQHDSLVREMEDLNREMEQLRGRETERLSELRTRARGRRAEDQDRQLAELRRAIDELARQSVELRSAMADAARATAGLEYLVPPTSPRPGPDPEEPRAEGFRPLTPYLLGSNRVAGAQVVDLQPELGAYFGVDGGVLIVDVSPGTPAAVAGMQPGDVVTRLDQVGVRSVDDLRFGVAQAGDTLPITLIRRGSSIQVLLRRR
jgi:hypothetical protein